LWASAADKNLKFLNSTASVVSIAIIFLKIFSDKSSIKQFIAISIGYYVILFPVSLIIRKNSKSEAISNPSIVGVDALSTSAFVLVATAGAVVLYQKVIYSPYLVFIEIIFWTNVIISLLPLFNFFVFAAMCVMNKLYADKQTIVNSFILIIILYTFAAMSYAMLNYELY
jgi:hypothetical protein